MGTSFPSAFIITKRSDGFLYVFGVLTGSASEDDQLGQVDFAAGSALVALVSWAYTNFG